jgi:prepilin-type N-terminal cleavage/methylation domain-containing protein/prepilin-type processing-associated H-X9-DG protein
MKKSAFTLIELLVVIAIIAVLASISIPVYSKVQERARAVQDANNLKQIGTSTIVYLGDNDDQLFTSGSTSWTQTLLASYLPDTKSFQSTFDKRPVTSGTSACNVSYGINSQAINTNMSKWVSPSLTIMFSPAVTGYDGGTPTFAGTSATDTTVTTPTVANKLGTHGGKNQINAVFGDGHVQANMLWRDYTDASVTNLWKPF